MNNAKPAMVCSADDLVVWKDFPKGLRVLLLDEDLSSAAETKLKLEAMDYIVISYYNEQDALEATSKKTENFHVAIVEVTTGSSDGNFRFLEMTKDLPTVVISNVRCLSTMMRCIALGAAEFLEKPLSEDKLRNIWQHVVHKAFNAGGNILSKSLKPIKETVSSMLQLQSETAELRIEVPFEAENKEKDQEYDHENSVSNEIFSAPSTPQLKQGGRLLDDGDYHDQPNCSLEKEGTENTKDSFEQRKYNSSESKSVDITCNNLTNVPNKKEDSPYRAEEDACEEEVDSADGSKTEECSAVKEGSLPSLHKIDDVESLEEDPKKKNSLRSISSHSHGNRSSRKRMKVDWTPELHRRFVQAVEQLGVDQAIPSKILELMKVEGLTRHNVASHLQKFRMHRRHILPKDDERRWQLHRDPMPRNYMPKPLLSFPHFHSNYGLPPHQVYPVWGHPSYLPSSFQMWGHAGFPPWHPPPEIWPWKTYPGIHADAWGCPIVPPYNQCTIPSQTPHMSNGLDAIGDRSKVLEDLYHLNPAEEVIDEVVKEVMSKPWLPLPLGLKPPSTDSVLAELHCQGIRRIPPTSSAAPPPRR